MEVLYEDNHILVVYKPKGVLSQADGSDKVNLLDMVKEYIKEKYHKTGNVYVGLVHRLDIFTSGIMVFARTSKAARRLSEDIVNHEFKKKYRATVEGKLENTEYVRITHNLKKNEKERKGYVDPNGQVAVLSYKVIRNYKIKNQEVSDIEVVLETGRFHQIRVQMSAIGHPLYGDRKYGSKNEIDMNAFPLEAYYLSFTHPITKQIMVFER